jgi:hypothetical protein
MWWGVPLLRQGLLRYDAETRLLELVLYLGMSVRKCAQYIHVHTFRSLLSSLLVVDPSLSSQRRGPLDARGKEDSHVFTPPSPRRQKLPKLLSAPKHPGNHHPAPAQLASRHHMKSLSLVFPLSAHRHHSQWLPTLGQPPCPK